MDQLALSSPPPPHASRGFQSVLSGGADMQKNGYISDYMPETTAYFGCQDLSPTPPIEFNIFLYVTHIDPV